MAVGRSDAVQDGPSTSIFPSCFIGCFVLTLLASQYRRFSPHGSMPRDEIRRILSYEESIRSSLIENPLTDPTSGPSDAGGDAGGNVHDGSRDPHGPSGSGGGDSNTHDDGTGAQGSCGSGGAANAGGAEVTGSCTITVSDDHPLSYGEVDDEDCETASSISMDQIWQMTARQAPAYAPYVLEQQYSRSEQKRLDITQWLANF